MSHGTPALRPAERNGRRVLITPAGVEIGLLHAAAAGTPPGRPALADAPVGTLLREHARHSEQQWLQAEELRRSTLADLRRLQDDLPPPMDTDADLRRGAVLVYAIVLALVLLAVLLTVVNYDAALRPLLP